MVEEAGKDGDKPAEGGAADAEVPAAANGDVDMKPVEAEAFIPINEPEVEKVLVPGLHGLIDDCVLKLWPHAPSCVISG